MSYPLITDAALTTAYTLAQARKLGYSLGEVRLGLTGEMYQFAYIDDDVDVTAGMTLAQADAAVSPHAATPDYTGGSALIYAGTNNNVMPVAGIAMAAADVSEGYRYMWIQTRGENAVALLTDTNVAASSRLVMDDADGTCAPHTVETDADPVMDEWASFGWAKAADTGTSLAIGDVCLNCLGV